MWPWQNSLSLVAEELMLSNLGSKNKSLIEFHWALLHGGSITLWSCDIIFISPVIERPQGLPSFRQMLKLSSNSCSKYFVMKFSKFCKKEKCSYSSWPACRHLYLQMKEGNLSKGNLSTNIILLKLVIELIITIILKLIITIILKLIQKQPSELFYEKKLSLKHLE